VSFMIFSNIPYSFLGASEPETTIIKMIVT
jgi:hypothetical protein